MSKTTGCRNDVGTAEPRVCDEAGRAPASPTAVVIGDSVALSWVPAVRQALPGWRIVALGYANCPAVLARVGEGERAADCATAQDEMLALAASIGPEMLFTSSAQSSLDRLASGAQGEPATAEWAEGVDAFIDRAASVSSNVVILGNPPSGRHPEECLTRFSSPAACESSLDAAWHEKAAVEASVAAASGATYVDVLPWFCTADGRCPMAIGDTVLRYDGAHLTYDASTSFGSPLRAALG